jgi:hypothetical protein
MVDGGTELFLTKPAVVKDLTVRSYKCEYATKVGADPQSCGLIDVTSPQTVRAVLDPGTLFRISAVYDGITGPPSGWVASKPASQLTARTLNTVRMVDGGTELFFTKPAV